MISSLIVQLSMGIRPKCFNLVIEVLLISREKRVICYGSCTYRFNLVIEVLLISRAKLEIALDTLLGFNLVIEVLLISRCARNSTQSLSNTFQSRNRGSFDFKLIYVDGTLYVEISFNLVIEVLLISSLACCSNLPSNHSFNLVIEVLLISSKWLSGEGGIPYEFQSRNRGSFDFKLAKLKEWKDQFQSFNLVIEVLLISSSNLLGWCACGYNVSIS